MFLAFVVLILVPLLPNSLGVRLTVFLISRFRQSLLVRGIRILLSAFRPMTSYVLKKGTKILVILLFRDKRFRYVLYESSSTA